MTARSTAPVLVPDRKPAFIYYSRSCRSGPRSNSRPPLTAEPNFGRCGVRVDHHPTDRILDLVHFGFL
jgi:hypothetical protein